MSSFAVGLMVGQLSVLIVLAVVIRFFVFADSPMVRTAVPDKEPTLEVQPAEDQSTDTILERTYYDVDNHAAESMDWFTVLLALVIRSVREQAIAHDNLLRELNAVFAGDHMPSFIDSIKITELNLGSDFPLLNNCRVVRTGRTDFSNGLEIRFDIDLKDTVTLGLDTRLLLNYPKSMFAYLPVSGAVSLVNFSGRAAVSLKTDDANVSYITLSFAPNFSMEFKVDSLVGGRSKLQNVPKLGQVVETTLRKRFADQCVAPNFLRFRLPGWHKRDTAPAATTGAPAKATTLAPTGPLAPTSATTASAAAGVAVTAATAGAASGPASSANGTGAGAASAGAGFSGGPGGSGEPVATPSLLGSAPVTPETRAQNMPGAVPALSPARAADGPGSSSATGIDLKAAHLRPERFARPKVSS